MSFSGNVSQITLASLTSLSSSPRTRSARIDACVGDTEDPSAEISSSPVAPVPRSCRFAALSLHEQQPLLLPPQAEADRGSLLPSGTTSVFHYGTNNDSNGASGGSIAPLVRSDPSNLATSAASSSPIDQSGTADDGHDIEDSVVGRSAMSGEPTRVEKGAQPTTPTPVERERWPPRNHYISGVLQSEGILYSALAQFLYACIALFFKLINNADEEGLRADQAVLVRMTMTWLCCTLYLWVSGDPHPLLGPPPVRHLLILRGLAGFFGVYGTYFALQYLNLADATVIGFIQPIMTSILGAVFLGEVFVYKEAVAACVSLVGVVLIARPGFLFKYVDRRPVVPLVASAPPFEGTSYWSISADSCSTFECRNIVVPALSPFGLETLQGPATDQQRSLATGVLLLGVLGSSIAYISIRKIGPRASAAHSVAYFSLWSSIVSGTLMWYKGESFVIPRQLFWDAVLLLIGVFGFFGQVFAALGLQKTTAGKAAATGYLQIVFATFFQLAFLHVPIAPLSLVGSLIIITSAICGLPWRRA